MSMRHFRVFQEILQVFLLWRFWTTHLDCGSIEVKVFEVPPYSVYVPYARVNHAKFMVTDNAAYIGEYYYFKV